MKVLFKYFSFLFGCYCILTFSSDAAENAMRLSRGQRIYVPAYSHIYSGNKARPFLLTVTLSIRNIDPVHPVSLTSVEYYETQGTLLKTFVDAPAKINPLESVRYVIPERDTSGGSGANFIVTWKSDVPVNPPIVESIMIGTQSSQGVSFTSRGREILSPLRHVEQ